MNESFIDIPPSVRHEISELIYSGNKIAAIKHYRKATNSDLVTAKQAVEAFTDQLRNTNPALFQESQHKGSWGIVAFFALLIVGVVAAKNIPENLKNEWLEKLDSLTQTAKQKVTSSTVVTKVTEPKQLIDHDTPYQPIAPDNIAADLTSLYRQKLANPEYVAWQNQPGIPGGYQDFIEEHHIKYARAKIAKNLTLPANTITLRIPLIPNTTIAIDGAIQHQEWLQAARIKLDPEEAGSILYLQADNDWLYLAADVPGDTTKDGYDQFRFYIHVDIDPAIKNERIHVSRGAPEALGGIRETRVLWQGEPPKSEAERWKKYPISDWRIYRMAKGASTMEQHRQFEAKLNLKESGLAIGTAFPVFVEIETDPLEDGKSRKRMYLGGLGNQNQPVWLIVQ